DYIARTRGTVELSAGAVKSGDGYRFTRGSGSYDAAAANLNATFAGAVRFRAHGDSLDLTFRGLTVRAAGTQGALIADVSAKDRRQGE
ncbi:HtaA domain-containing protein, partial [Streptomyces sp. URMC 126]|uniref:HtaA domain-containing protein n=1 Tax=Streptomyces sp. URMC 126 TaxID=3423401 RepID=UPI003F197F47